MDRLTDLGRIKVTVQRVYLEKRAVPQRCPKDDGDQITEVSEKMLKGKAIVSTVR